jgi:hypothetical protein
MLLVEHRRPQAPQFTTSALVCTSQPSLCLLPLQSANPTEHVPLHVEDEHVGVGMWLDEQTTPHAPQLATEFDRLASHPSDCRLLLQSANPTEHVPLQKPPEHAGAGTWFDEHAIPQPPQFAASLAIPTSHPSPGALLQFWKPEAQVPRTQVLLTHDVVA